MPNIHLWEFIRPYLKPYKSRLLTLAFFPIIWCLVETIAPFLIKIAIDRLTYNTPEGPGTQSTLVSIALLYALLMFILEAAIRACNYIWIKTFPIIRSNMQSSVLSTLKTHNYDFFYNQFSGNLVSKYRNLTDSFENIAKSLLYGFYPALLSFVFSLAFIAFINLSFAAVFLGWFLAMSIVTVLFYEKSVHSTQKQAKKQNLLFGYVGDMFSNILTLMAYPRNITQEKDFQRLQHESVQSTQQAEFVTFKADLWRSVLSWILLAMMITFLSYGWQKHWITLGDFSFIAAVCFYVRRTIWMTSTQLSDFFREIGTAKEALSLINTVNPKENSLPARDKSSPLDLQNTIEFSQIRFGYTKNQHLFNNLNFQISPAQKIGISGTSGIGKTTLVHLLLRLHDPDQGIIKVNGEDYRKIPIGHLRDLFSYVPQNPMLLHRSIYENIAIGNPLASPDEVYEAAQCCFCEEFILPLEQGYDTIVGEGGYKLSGGQRQRIAIARAYLKKAPIFILDEATSALDLNLEEELLDRLLTRLKDHTIILISHRASSLGKMERVITFQQGQIVDDTHNPYYPPLNCSNKL